MSQGKYQDNRFDDALVQGAFEMIQSWQPQPFPTWVTCVPSLNRPELVQNFARSLAQMLNLPFVPVVRKVRSNNQIFFFCSLCSFFWGDYIRVFLLNSDSSDMRATFCRAECGLKAEVRSLYIMYCQFLKTLPRTRKGEETSQLTAQAKIYFY